MILKLIYLKHYTASPLSPKTRRLNCSAIDRKIPSFDKRFRNRTIINFCTRSASELFSALRDKCTFRVAGKIRGKAHGVTLLLLELLVAAKNSDVDIGLLATKNVI